MNIFTKAMRHKVSFIISLSLFCILCLSAQQEEIPKIVDPVTDETNTLSRSEYYDLRRQIIHFEDSTSNQIVVLIISTLGENEIRDFGMRILEKNKIGQKGKDNGILILIAKDDRKMSIEVGYGLEGVLTDALCDQIIRKEMRPRFRESDYYGGLSAAINSITQVIKGEYTADEKNGNDDAWFPILIFLLAGAFGLFSMFRNKRHSISSRGYNSWWWGGGGGGSSGGFGSFGGGGGSGGWSSGGGSFGGGGSSGSW
jgi:uncharacterized protein